MAEDNWWAGDAYATAASAKASGMPAAPPGVRSRAKPTAQDMKDLSAASAKAQAERDAQRFYASTEKAVREMGTGPGKARWLDAITPDAEDGGILDTIGGFAGALPSSWLGNDERTMNARANLKTVAAQTGLATAAQQKGTASDSDMAMIRTAGISPAKPVQENLRILRAAKQAGRISQARALFTSSWISKYGSVGNSAPRGMTFEQGLSRFERSLTTPNPRALPKAPPATRGNSGRLLEIDINGNPIR